MKHWAIYCFSALFLSLCAVAAEPQMSFSGTWILDSKNSEPFPHPVMGLSSGFDMSGGDISADTSGRGGGTLSSRDMVGGSRGGGVPGRMPAGSGPQQAMDEPPMIIRQSETDLEISRTAKMNGTDVPVVDKYKTDGSEAVSMMPMPNSTDQIKISTKATLKKNKFTVRTINFYPQGKSEIKREYTLSKDGKTLTLNTTSVSSRGQVVQRQIYQRQ